MSKATPLELARIGAPVRTTGQISDFLRPLADIDCVTLSAVSCDCQ